MKACRKKIIVFLVAVALVSGGFGAVSVQLDARPARPMGATRNSMLDSAGRLTAENQESRIENRPGRELLFKMMLSVLLVVALGAAAIYISKKLALRITNSPGRQIHILETAHLGPRKAVHLIEISPLDARSPAGGNIENQESRLLLVGSTNENITTLADVTGI